MRFLSSISWQNVCKAMKVWHRDVWIETKISFLLKMELLSVVMLWMVVDFCVKNFLFILCGVYQCDVAQGIFKATYTDSSSFFWLARQLSLPFQTPLERLPSIWLNIPNTRMRWFSQTSPCLLMASPALVSSLRALWLCADHFWDLFCYRLRWLEH